MALFFSTNPDYQRLINGFREAMEARNLSLGHTTSHVASVWEFLSWVEAHGIVSIDRVETGHIIDYFDYLETRPNTRKGGTLSQRTISGTHVLALKGFFAYLLESKELDSVPLFPGLRRGEYRQMDILSEEEIKELYSACETLRDRALLSCAYGAGLRRSEIYSLDVEHIELSKARLTVIEGKGRKTQGVVLCEAVVNDFREYLYKERQEYMIRGREYSRAFLLNNKGKRMGANHLNDRIKELVELSAGSGLQSKDVTLHTLRRSIGTHLIDRGADLVFVQSFLRHSSIDTSHIYLMKRRQKMLIQTMMK